MSVVALSVSELTAAIKSTLERRFVTLCVKGEISNFKQQSSGHLYFTLKDEEAQIAVVMFKGSTLGLDRLPKEGDKVTLEGELSVYAPRGNYQILAKKLTFAGIGDLAAKLHETKKQLEQMGWFAKDRKRPLPAHPKTIGVVTSPTGAVIQDIIQILKRRVGKFHLVLYPVKVQGVGAAAEIATGINFLNRHKLADILIVGRGGGSLEDLWPFNEIVVAEAIYNSKIPVISAVGHETDFSISDFVADVRAPTPSAAAEMASAQTAQHIEFLSSSRQRILQIMQMRLKYYRSKIEGARKHPYLTSKDHILSKYVQKLDDMIPKLEKAMQAVVYKRQYALLNSRRRLAVVNPRERLARLREKFASVAPRLDTLLLEGLERRKRSLNQMSSHLQSINPKNLLSKGYSILFRENKNSVIVNAAEVSPGEKIRAVAYGGTIISTVDRIENE